MTELLIGRQPIFNRSLDVIGYELLYRTPQSPHRAIITDGDLATTQVLLNSFSMIGLENLIGHGIGFFNITENFLIGKYPIPFPPQKLALEVLEDTPITPHLVESLTNLWRQGYQIVLDDVKDIERVMPLLNIARMVKLDLPAINLSDLPGMISYFKRLGIKTVAEKVETFQDFERCQRMGFDYFQGYFLYKPNVFRTRKIDSSRTVILHALIMVNSPNASFKDLEDYISRDVTITYKLLRLVNSAYYSNRVSIRSISQAISIIGVNYLRGWLTLMMISASEKKPNELTVTALIRAKFCELLAQTLQVDPRHVDMYFVSGLFSVLDAFLDMPLEKAIQGLPLSEEIVDALLFYKGTLGEVLRAVVFYERGDLNKVLDLGLPAEQVTDIYVKTLQWANNLIDIMQETIPEASIEGTGG